MKLRLALLTAVFALLPAGTAQALSCVRPEDVVAQADRAFIGTLTSRDGDLLTFDITEQIRGDLPDPILVREELAASNWAIGATPGTEIGLVVHDRAGEFTASPCGVVPPELLRRARSEPAPPLRTYGPLSEQPWWRPWPGRPPEVRVLPDRRLVARGRWADLRLSCSAACSGKAWVRSSDGALLGGARFTLDSGAGIASVPLSAAARRRLRRDPRIQVRIGVRLDPASYSVTYGGSLILRRR